MDHDVVAEQGVAGKRSVIDEGFITDEGIADDDGIVDEADDAIDVDIIEDNAPAEPQAALFTGDNAAEFRSRWDAVQRNFVDDPAKALRDGDALVCELINELARVFADARTARESKQARGGAGATETMRLELRRRRALFETLLAL